MDKGMGKWINGSMDERMGGGGGSMDGSDEWMI
jgi:hypothetical protein